MIAAAHMWVQVAEALMSASVPPGSCMARIMLHCWNKLVFLGMFPPNGCVNVLQVAEALMSASVPPGSCMARIMLFTGGPGTEGMGKVIGRDLTEEIRR
jgi:hypothetical protein